MGYYLADVIYPRWTVFVKTIRCPLEEKKIFFAGRQEAVCKDLERAFGVLQARWAAVKGPTHLWNPDCIVDVLYVCIIMHSVIVEQEGPELTDWTNEDDAAEPSHDVATASVRMGVPHDEAGRLQAHADMRQQDAHIQLQKDLIEELWTRRGAR
ncbi:uncharacterized protein LOC125209371 [Salvia hispanica]|uniref:uncharacterized protein LOC125209371 n=1 Tax=Salvia hispanica TaxID=49212 RepID=UPI00200967E6|nr:uncharacterized protein LOC125209371 [Salvia hispanica]